MTDQSVPSSRAARRGRGSIQSKLLLMLLLTSILSSVVVGWFGYRSGTEALRESAYSRLTELRNERAKAITDYAANIRGAVVLDSQGIGVRASRAFNTGFTDLADQKIDDTQRAALRTYYTDVFVPNLTENVGGDIDPDAFIPSKPARSYLQSTYTTKFNDFDEAIKLDDPGDGSKWTAANAEFNPYFRAAVTELGLDDAMLLDNEGNVVYSAYKGSDLGSNIKTGEYKGGGLEEVFDAAQQSNTRDFVAVADFEQYQPAYGAPTLFIASPVGSAGNLTGVLVYEVSAEKINGVMSGDLDADKFAGLGDGGETFLVGPGPDGTQTMRSSSRMLIEHPDDFERASTDRGTSQATVDRMLRTKSSILLQLVKSDGADRASRGQSGTTRTTDYLGRDVLGSYAPVELEGLDWSIVANIEASEALEPVNDFARNILLATAGIVLLVSLAAVLMARVFTSPLNRLLAGVRAVAGGQLGARVDAGSKDEFGDLAAAFNDMSSSLRSKQDLLEAQQTENENLLRSLMPEAVVKRYRGGETGIADEHQNVTVALTDIEGFDQFAARLEPAESLTLLGALSRSVEEIAREVGVEKVRSSGTSYVVSSGLVAQRVDHVRRAADFALGVATVVERFNAQHSASLSLRAGLDTGTVRSGLLGDGVVYDLWGEAVNLAYRLRSVAGAPGVYVTDAVKDRLAGAFGFEQVGMVASEGQDKPVWRLTPIEQAAR